MVRLKPIPMQIRGSRSRLHCNLHSFLSNVPAINTSKCQEALSLSHRKKSCTKFNNNSRADFWGPEISYRFFSSSSSSSATRKAVRLAAAGRSKKRSFFSAIAQLKDKVGFGRGRDASSVGKGGEDDPHDLPFCGVSGLRYSEDFPELASQAIRRAAQRMDAVAEYKEGLGTPQAKLRTGADVKRLLQLLDDTSNDLCLVADAAELCRNVHPHEHWV